jgi:hypothetical protein
MVFSQNAGTNGSTDWGNVFSNQQTVLTHATLDCNRRPSAATGTTGLLYIASGAGKMVAIIVDSPKLDDAALWPKYQRTAGNAGNSDTARFPLNPGCP